MAGQLLGVLNTVLAGDFAEKGVAEEVGRQVDLVWLGKSGVGLAGDRLEGVVDVLSLKAPS